VGLGDAPLSLLPLPLPLPHMVSACCMLAHTALACMLTQPALACIEGMQPSLTAPLLPQLRQASGSGVRDIGKQMREATIGGRRRQGNDPLW
jgi:hypothetical protein